MCQKWFAHKCSLKIHLSKHTERGEDFGIFDSHKDHNSTIQEGVKDIKKEQLSEFGDVIYPEDSTEIKTEPEDVDIDPLDCNNV